MREDIIVFPENYKNVPFAIEMCGTSYCDGTYKINRPKSQICCIEYVYEGTGCVRCNETVFSPCGGDVYILPASLDHFYYSDSENPWKKIWFNIKGDFANKTLEAYNLKNIYHIQNIDVAPLFENFIKNAEDIKNNVEYDFDICASDFLHIIQRLSKHISEKASFSALSAEQILKKRIDGLTDFSVSFEEILEGFYYTKSHIIRIFKKKYGITPYEYFLLRKISAAKILMRNTALSITEISEHFGFSNCHYFSNFFKKRTGLSPREYRNNMQHR